MHQPIQKIAKKKKKKKKKKMIATSRSIAEAARMKCPLYESKKILNYSISDVLELGYRYRVRW